jgi:hypothetical protein
MQHKYHKSEICKDGYFSQWGLTGIWGDLPDGQGVRVQQDGSADSRFATTQPAEPAPTMT